MAAAENLKSKRLYKIEIGILKLLPFIISILYFVNTLFSLFAVDLPFLSYFSGLSLLPWIFILLSSFVFRFCIYHRIPLYYILVNDLVNILDSKLEIPLDDLWYMGLHAILFFAAFCLVFLLRKKCKKQC